MDIACTVIISLACQFMWLHIHVHTQYGTGSNAYGTGSNAYGTDSFSPGLALHRVAIFHTQLIN